MTIIRPSADVVRVILAAGTSLALLFSATANPPSSRQDRPEYRDRAEVGDGALAGDPVCGIFVSPAGSNSNSGLSTVAPVLTINFAIQRAQAEGLSCVFLRAGNYTERVNLASGITIVGGFNSAWVFDYYAVPGHTATIVSNPAAAPQTTIRATGLSGSACGLTNLVVRGPNVTTPSGANSHALHLLNCTAPIVLKEVRSEAGNAANGANGANGSAASQLAAPGGGSGADSVNIGAGCSTGYAAGGSAGTNACAGSTANAGAGGTGGSSDTDCAFLNWNFNARSGTNGGNAGDFVTGGHGYRGSAGGVCLLGGNGNNGRLQQGSGGAGGNSVSSIVADEWKGDNGEAGTLGSHGTGGGGGGGGGGCDDSGNNRGAGGGGGGAGGCRAPVAGSGGGSGGGSFGVFASNCANISMHGVAIQRANAGDGGRGGNGGLGQPGGLGGLGGFSSLGDHGGDGGDGGRGGNSGAGGGGAGGISAGYYCHNSFVAVQNVTCTGGSAGGGGNGGTVGMPGVPGVGGTLVIAVSCSTTALVAPASCPSLPCIDDCPADINNDNTVNVTDLLAVISAWGGCANCPPSTCNADTNGDCLINVTDLLAVISAWGNCP